MKISNVLILLISTFVTPSWHSFVDIMLSLTAVGISLRISKEKFPSVIGGVSVLEMLLQSSGPLPANRGSDALVADEFARRQTEQTSTSTVAPPAADVAPAVATAALRGARERHQPWSPVLLHRLLTEGAPGVDVRTASSDVGNGNDGRVPRFFSFLVFFSIVGTMR
jgi:hypothetical protein